MDNKPFVSNESEKQRRMIRIKLAESEAIANNPNAKRYTHDEIFEPLREKIKQNN